MLGLSSTRALHACADYLATGSGSVPAPRHTGIPRPLSSPGSSTRDAVNTADASSFCSTMPLALNSCISGSSAMSQCTSQQGTGSTR